MMPMARAMLAACLLVYVVGRYLFRWYGFEKSLHESRSPDGDGLPIVKGLGDERAFPLSARGEESYQLLAPQQARVHARGVVDRNDNSLLKPADGSEPSDSLSNLVPFSRSEKGYALNFSQKNKNGFPRMVSRR